MTHSKKFIYSPGGENESGTTASDNNEVQKESANVIPDGKDEKKPEGMEDKPVIEKIREVLQDWANKDEADLDFDDTRV
ncbi:MAG: hypothetical protein ABI707_13730 [Ferruginibacter sp.]